MGLVSALGASTSALAVDLDATTPVPDVVAQDTLLSNVVILGTTIPTFQTAHGLIEDTEIGVGIAENDQNFIRIDLTGAVFGADASAIATSDCAGAVITAIDGGAAADDFVVYGMLAGNGGCPQTTEFNLAAIDLGYVGGTSVSVRLRQFEGQTEAINEGADLYDISGTAVVYDDTLDVSANSEANAQVGEVSTNFTLFQGATAGSTANTVNVGAISLELSEAIDSQGAAANATTGDSYTVASTAVVVSGDFSFGTWTFDDQADCAGTSLDPVVSEDFTTLTTDLTVPNNIDNFVGDTLWVCVQVDEDEDTINESTYSWTTVPVAITNGVNTPGALGASLGSITRNGTTVNIPYLTTFADYNQRLVIVNRGATVADYTITFTTEDGTTATADTAATGSVQPDEVLSLRVSDIVDITGSTTRTAATLVVVAPSANIDVATNQVNLEDGSTDTVVYN